ncbi:MAG TPA: hypothetical protein VF739_01845 [Ktedonobacterales bacterium]
MPSLMDPSATEQHLTAITSEGATLPVIRAAGFEARVNAYVVGRTERTERIHRMTRTQAYTGQRGTPSAESASSGRSPGCSGGATDLWYLSLVAPRGHGTTLRAIWANLVGNTHHAVWLEGVGMVALGHQRLDLSGPGGSGGLGYPLHWTYRQAVIPPSRDVQGVLECDLLTCYDPLLAPIVTRASRHSRAWRGKPNAKSAPEALRSDRSFVTLSSATSTNVSQEEDETRAREAHPLFLLLDRTHPVEPVGLHHQERDQESAGWSDALARLHLRYLATRIPWLPYYPAWADYLWQRALARGEAEPLHVWSYGAAPTAMTDLPNEPVSAADHSRLSAANTQAAHSGPSLESYLTAAYLCHPDPLALTADLSQAIAAGRFRTEPREASHGAAAEAERAA